jgi:hypothetical protein
MSLNEAVIADHQTAVTLLYTIAGKSLRVNAADQALADLMQRFLSGLQGRVTRADDLVEADFVIELSRGLIPALSSALFPVEIPDGSFYVDRDASYLDVGKSRFTFKSSSPGTAILTIGESPYLCTPMTVSSLFVYAVHAALRHCGLFSIHAAGLVSPDNGTGILIAGDSGSGKSTLTMHLAQNGWRYLSDDLMLLEPESDLVKAYGLRRRFAATALTLSLFDQIKPIKQDTSAGLPDFDKQAFEPTRYFTGGRVESSIPTVVYFPVITRETTTSIKKLSKSEVIGRLIKLCPWSCYDKATAGGHLEVLGCLTKQCESYSILAGEDLLMEPGRASELIIKHLRESL